MLVAEVAMRIEIHDDYFKVVGLPRVVAAELEAAGIGELEGDAFLTDSLEAVEAEMLAGSRSC